MANITIKRYNGSSWDTHYPKTTISQVIDLSTALANMQGDINGKIDLKSNTDNRTVVTKPNDYNSKLSIAGLKQNTTIGVSGEGTYSGVIGIRGWSDSSGGNAHELAFGGNGGLYHRHGATTSWNTWKKIAYLEDFGAWAKKSSLAHGDIPYATSSTKGGVRVEVVGTSMYLYTTD